MHAITLIPLAQVGYLGLGLLFGLSLLAAILGMAGFVGALIVLWHDSQLDRVPQRRNQTSAKKTPWPIGGRRRATHPTFAGASKP